MASPLVSVRLPADLLESTERIVKADGYASTQEFIREAVRKLVQEHDLRELKKLYGIAKGKRIKPLTREERDQIARELLAER